LLPPKGGPNFNLGAEDGKENNEHLLSGQLNDMVKGKVPVREIISWIDESVFSNNSLEVTLRVVVQTLLNIGSKSFTHLITVLERYGQVISKICPDEDKQIMLIAEVSSFWKNNTQMTAIAIDRMMSYRLVSNLAIVRWVFSEENVEQFHTTDRPWEVLNLALIDNSFVVLVYYTVIWNYVFCFWLYFGMVSFGWLILFIIFKCGKQYMLLFVFWSWWLTKS